MMRKYSLLALLVLLVMTGFLSSCKKDASFCRIIRIYSGDSTRVDFIYGGELLSEMTYRTKAGMSQGSTIYNYTTEGRLSGYEDLDSTGVTLRKTEYIYDSNGKVIKENYYVKDGSTLPLSSYYDYEYNSDGTLKKYIYHVGSIINSTFYFTEYDSKGNNTKGYSTNYLGAVVDTFYYTYDDHPNFKASFNFLDGLNKNNVLISKSVVPGMGTYTDTYTYQYNSNGYVIYAHEALDDEISYIDYECDN